MRNYCWIPDYIKRNGFVSIVMKILHIPAITYVVTHKKEISEKKEKKKNPCFAEI